MGRFRMLASGCAAALAAACAGGQGSETRPDPAASAAPISRDGVVYAPAGIGPHGCVLYRVRIPGGRAPAALMYLGEDGKFSYGRPDRCVAGDGTRKRS